MLHKLIRLYALFLLLLSRASFWRGERNGNRRPSPPAARPSARASGGEPDPPAWQDLEGMGRRLARPRLRPASRSLESSEW
jgi:hypothetical protein